MSFQKPKSSSFVADNLSTSWFKPQTPKKLQPNLSTIKRTTIDRNFELKKKRKKSRKRAKFCKVVSNNIIYKSNRIVLNILYLF